MLNIYIKSRFNLIRIQSFEQDIIQPNEITNSYTTHKSNIFKNDDARGRRKDYRGFTEI